MVPADTLENELHKVCVMDGSGKIGSSLIRKLLKRGYTVHAAVQDHDELMGLAKIENKKLKIFEADPFDYHSILEALKGCSGLFYSFEPSKDYPLYDESTVEMEARAAHNVLEACGQTETIDKVVFTSSATAIIWRDHHPHHHDLSPPSTPELDEKQWSDINLCRKLKLWYALSKTLAEKTAWALAMDRGINMVSVNSGLLMSPDLTIENPYLKGAAEMYMNGVLVTVDLDFLVNAHISVYEDVSAFGRYVCFDNVIGDPEDAVKLANVLAPPSPTHSHSYEEEKSNLMMIEQRISNKKLNKLMVDLDTATATQLHQCL